MDTFLAEKAGNFSFRLRIIETKDNHSPLLFNRSSILFFQELLYYNHIKESFIPVRYQNQAITYFVYFAKTSYSELEEYININSVNLGFDNKLFQRHTYYITIDADKINLSINEWNLKKKCNWEYLRILNSYSKKSLKWMKKLKAYEKFLNFNGCELVLMLPYHTIGHNQNIYHWGYASNPQNDTNFQKHGISHIIFKIMAQKFNFVDSYTIASLNGTSWLSNDTHAMINLINVTDFKNPQVYFDVQGIQTLKLPHIRMTHTFVDLKFEFFVTPAEAYTAYDKLFLPFDLETWVLLAVTFTLTFIVIFILNHWSKTAQHLFYGANVDTLILNVVSIFFGISQTRLSSENFSRFILILFVFFCLIFRTCYQGKLFTFITSEPKRSPPQTIQDLVDQNYSIHCTNTQILAFKNFINHDHEEWPNVQNCTKPAVIEYYLTQSQNSSARMCLIIDDVLRMDLDRRKYNGWNQLKDLSMFVSHEGIAAHQSSFYFRMLKMTVDRLIDTGIIKYLVDNHFGKKMQFKNEELPKIFSLADLAFEFKIWLVFCGLSTSVFAIEMALGTKSKIKVKIKFAKIHPIAENIVTEFDSIHEMTTCHLLKDKQFEKETEDYKDISVIDLDKVAIDVE